MGACLETGRGRIRNSDIHRNDMKTILLFSFVLIQIAPIAVEAQSPANPPDFTGVWGVYRPGRGGGGDPKLAVPPAGPLALKPEYAKPYEARGRWKRRRPSAGNNWLPRARNAFPMACLR